MQMDFPSSPLCVDLKQDILEAMGDQKNFPVGGIWVNEIFTMLGEHEAVLMDVVN